MSLRSNEAKGYCVKYLFKIYGQAFVVLRHQNDEEDDKSSLYIQRVNYVKYIRYKKQILTM